MADSDKKKKKGGMVLVISVGGKPPKSPEDTSKPDVKKAIPEAQSPEMGMDELIARLGNLFDEGRGPYEHVESDIDLGDPHSGTHGTYGKGDPTAPFGEPMEPGDPLIEPTANVPINPDENVNPKIDDYMATREQRHREIPNYRDPDPDPPADILDDYGDEEALLDALEASSPEVPPSSINMDDPMDLGEDMGESKEDERPSLLETMQDRYGAQRDEEGNVTQMPSMGPTGIKRLASGQPPMNVFRRSEDPFLFAWQLLKAVDFNFDPDNAENPDLYHDQYGPTDEYEKLLQAILNQSSDAPPTEDEPSPDPMPHRPAVPKTPRGSVLPKYRTGNMTRNMASEREGR